MKTYPVRVVPVRLEPHPNADSLSIVRVGGFQCVVRTSSWEGVDIGAFVPPDSVVPEALAPVPGATRIRAVKLRGEYSEGLLVPAPEGAAIGDDVADVLGITHYEPVPEERGIQQGDSPPSWCPTYDLDNVRSVGGRRWDIGAPLVITEKIHGENWRAVFADGRLYVGSRTEWKVRATPDGRLTVPWSALESHPEIVAWLESHPGHTVYGEAYGGVGKFPYDVTNGRKIRVFDIYTGGRFLDWPDVAASGLPLVPVLDVVEWAGDVASLNPYAEGMTTLGGKHIREGAVVRPVSERGGERGVLKLVGRAYLAKGAA